MEFVTFNTVRNRLFNDIKRQSIVPIIGSGFSRGCRTKNGGSVPSGEDYKKQQPNGRSNCALYNDPSLEGLFSRMLPFVDISNAMLHDDYIEFISK